VVWLSGPRFSYNRVPAISSFNPVAWFVQTFMPKPGRQRQNPCLFHMPGGWWMWEVLALVFWYFDIEVTWLKDLGVSISAAEVGVILVLVLSPVHFVRNNRRTLLSYREPITVDPNELRLAGKDLRVHTWQQLCEDRQLSTQSFSMTVAVIHFLLWHMFQVFMYSVALVSFTNLMNREQLLVGRIILCREFMYFVLMSFALWVRPGFLLFNPAMVWELDGGNRRPEVIQYMLMPEKWLLDVLMADVYTKSPTISEFQMKDVILLFSTAFDIAALYALGLLWLHDEVWQYSPLAIGYVMSSLSFFFFMITNPTIVFSSMAFVFLTVACLLFCFGSQAAGNQTAGNQTQPVGNQTEGNQTANELVQLILGNHTANDLVHVGVEPASFCFIVTYLILWAGFAFAERRVELATLPAVESPTAALRQRLRALLPAASPTAAAESSGGTELAAEDNHQPIKQGSAGAEDEETGGATPMSGEALR